MIITRLAHTMLAQLLDGRPICAVLLESIQRSSSQRATEASKEAPGSLEYKIPRRGDLNRRVYFSHSFMLFIFMRAINVAKIKLNIEYDASISLRRCCPGLTYMLLTSQFWVIIR